MAFFWERKGITLDETTEHNSLRFRQTPYRDARVNRDIFVGFFFLLRKHVFLFLVLSYAIFIISYFNFFFESFWVNDNF